jgi:hypothetical protein
MHREYLGDSYDLVKRFLSQALEPVGTLHAHPEFVPEDIRKEYLNLTGIPILGDESPEGPFGVLLDPDTGFTLGRKTPKHATLKSILDLNQKNHPNYVICFDQSHHRKNELDRDGQRETKMRILWESGLSSFYYKSHAPFLFTSQEEETLSHVVDSLVSAGIPKCRLQGRGVAPAAAA